jgi:hypothetical protein
MAFLAVIFLMAGVLIWYLTVNLQLVKLVEPPPLTRAESLRYLPVAVLAAVVVLVVDGAVIALVVRKLRRD